MRSGHGGNIFGKPAEDQQLQDEKGFVDIITHEQMIETDIWAWKMMEHRPAMFIWAVISRKVATMEQVMSWWKLSPDQIKSQLCDAEGWLCAIRDKAYGEERLKIEAPSWNVAAEEPEPLPGSMSYQWEVESSPGHWEAVPGHLVGNSCCCVAD